MWSTSQVSEATTTTEALFSGPNRLKHLNVRKREVCIDCNAKYWSDEGSKYPTVTARRKKIKGNCFICLKQGHHQRDFKTNKACVYCKARKRHHRSLCVNKFPVEQPSETANPVTEPLSATVTTGSTLLASDEQVLKQIATVEGPPDHFWIQVAKEPTSPDS